MRHIGQSLKHMVIAGIVGLMSVVANQAAAKPLKVFILAGQSNMQGHVNVSTFDSMADDPKTAPILKEIRTADGKPVVCRNVWISSIGCAGDDTTEQKGKLTAGFGSNANEIGPEFTFGIYMEKQLKEPILIIKTSWGGRDLHTCFRPPSAGPYVWSAYEVNQRKGRHEDVEKQKADKIKDTGAAYRQMIEHVRKVLADPGRIVPGYNPKQGCELAGFVWFQGFNDLVSTWSYEDCPNGCNQPGGYDLYSKLMADFIRDVRKDLSAPEMPFVIGVMGLNGMTPPQNELYFRQAQAAPASLPEFNGNVVAVQTAPFWSENLGAIEKKKGKVGLMRHLLNSKDKGQANADGKMTAAQIDKYVKDYEAKLITPAEIVLWESSVSNGGYHYLGAAKIMAPIGKAFAEAIVSLQKAPRRKRR